MSRYQGAGESQLRNLAADERSQLQERFLHLATVPSKYYNGVILHPPST